MSDQQQQQQGSKSEPPSPLHTSVAEEKCPADERAAAAAELSPPNKRGCLLMNVVNGYLAPPPYPPPHPASPSLSSPQTAAFSGSILRLRQKSRSEERVVVSSSSSSLSPLEEGRLIGIEVKAGKCCKTDFKISKCTAAQFYLPSTTTQTNTQNSPADSGNRFKIVNAERKYQRGRWDVVEYSNAFANVTSDDDTFVKEKKPYEKLQRVSTTEMIQKLAFNNCVFPDTSSAFGGESQPFSFADQRTSSNDCNIRDCEQSQISDLARAAHITPTMIRRHSLAPPGSASSYGNSKPNSQVRLYRNKSQHAGFSRSNNNANNESVLVYSQSLLHDIDHKIEQAMDLVKTHLMFAVREEIEVLQCRILELESQVFRLEMENSILKQHMPPEIFKNLENTKCL